MKEAIITVAVAGVAILIWRKVLKPKSKCSCADCNKSATTELPKKDQQPAAIENQPTLSFAGSNLDRSWLNEYNMNKPAISPLGVLKLVK